MASPLRVGFVPEHFSTPLHYALTRFPPTDQPLPIASPYPSGTGAMVSALRAGEIDLAIGLTEGFVAALGKPPVASSSSKDDDPGFRLVGTYVVSPLRWAISTGSPSASEGSGFTRSTPAPSSIADLRGAKVGVSRIGSGSYVMAFVLAEREGWLDGSGENGHKPFSDFVVLDNFANLRSAVNDGRADFFMWEHFTTKKYHDAGEVARVGDIYTPWPSWLIAASTKLLGSSDSKADPRIASFLSSLDKGIAHFNARRNYDLDLQDVSSSGPGEQQQHYDDDPVSYISTHLDYSAADAREWLDTVEFAGPATKGVELDLVRGCVSVLRKAGVLPRVGEARMEAEDMVADV